MRVARQHLTPATRLSLSPHPLDGLVVCSLMVLVDVPDYADRQKRLVTLQNRLEALLSPRLVESFGTHNFGALASLRQQ